MMRPPLHADKEKLPSDVHGREFFFASCRQIVRRRLPGEAFLMFRKYFFRQDVTMFGVRAEA